MLITKQCPVCNNLFKTKRGSKKEKTTCSLSCSNSFFRTGKRNGAWRKDEEVSYRVVCWRYHQKKCVVCGEENILSVHHYDENNTNNHPTNLVPLCPTHHSYIHSRYKNKVEKIVKSYVNNFKKRYEKGVYVSTNEINIKELNNFKELVDELGYANGGNGYRAAQQYVIENNLDISHFPKRTKTKDMNIMECNSLADVVRNLGYATSGYGYKKAKEYIRNYNLDVSHF